ATTRASTACTTPATTAGSSLIFSHMCFLLINLAQRYRDDAAEPVRGTATLRAVALDQLNRLDVGDTGLPGVLVLEVDQRIRLLQRLQCGVAHPGVLLPAGGAARGPTLDVEHHQRNADQPLPLRRGQCPQLVAEE